MEFIKERKFIIIISLVILLGVIYKLCNKKDEYDYNIFENDIINNQAEEKTESKEEIILHISGEVINEGIVKLNNGDRISDAIEKAGGTTKEADISKINLAYKLKDGQKIYIPSIYDEEITEYIIDKAGKDVLESNEKTDKVNINTANQTELETLSGIGTSTAMKIIQYRETNGKFKSIEDLMKVNGIGKAKFSNIKDNIEI